MKNRHEPKICSLTGKVGFSETQANRRLGKYDEIVRYYHCSDEKGCNLFHLTHETVEETLDNHTLSASEACKLLTIRVSHLERTVASYKKSNRKLIGKNIVLRNKLLSLGVPADGLFAPMSNSAGSV